jgi:hypothetical protein
MSQALPAKGMSLGQERGTGYQKLRREIPRRSMTMAASGFDWILAGTICGLIIVAIGAYAALLWYVLS